MHSPPHEFLRKSKMKLQIPSMSTLGRFQGDRPSITKRATDLQVSSRAVTPREPELGLEKGKFNLPAIATHTIPTLPSRVGATSHHRRKIVF